MGITIFLVIAVVVVALVFAQRLNARRLLRDEQRSTTGPSAPPPSPGSPAGSSDEITARIEDDVERMGITVAPEEIQRIAEQIRAAKASGEGPDEEPEQVLDGDACRRPAPSVRARAVVVVGPERHGPGRVGRGRARSGDAPRHGERRGAGWPMALTRRRHVTPRARRSRRPDRGIGRLGRDRRASRQARSARLIAPRCATPVRPRRRRRSRASRGSERPPPMPRGRPGSTRRTCRSRSSASRSMTPRAASVA